MNSLQPEDFYVEQGRLVFTEAYHRKRGCCCHSGCRHCPWRDPDGPGRSPRTRRAGPCRRTGSDLD